MKKVLLSGLFAICIFGLVGCSTQKDTCKHDFLEGAVPLTPFGNNNIYTRILLN